MVLRTRDVQERHRREYHKISYFFKDDCVNISLPASKRLQKSSLHCKQAKTEAAHGITHIVSYSTPEVVEIIQRDHIDQLFEQCYRTGHNRNQDRSELNLCFLFEFSGISSR